MPFAPAEIVPEIKTTFEGEVTETRKKTVIGVDDRQDRTSLSEIRASRMTSLSKREDDWFALLEKPVLVPPGTFHCQIGQDTHCAFKKKKKKSHPYLCLFLCLLLRSNLLVM